MNRNATPATSPATMPSILDIGRYINAIDRRYDGYDHVMLRTAPGTDEHTAANAAMTMLNNEMLALMDVVFARPAETLADVAVQAKLALHAADSASNSCLVEMLTTKRLDPLLQQFRQVFLSILRITAPAAGVEVDGIGRFESEGYLDRFLPRQEGRP